MSTQRKIIPIDDPGKDPQLRDLKEFLNNHYDFYFNSVIEKPAYRRKGDDNFSILEDYHLNSIYFRIISNGIKVKIETLRRLLESDWVKKINPIKDWILALPQIVGTEYIDKIIDSVEFDDEESRSFFQRAFVKWFVALVANVFDETRCTNHTCLVFTGDQGKRKTTWFNNLIPVELEPYKFNGKINPNSNDTLSLIHSRLLIIIDDQLKQINKKDENDIKELITKDKVTYRKPYATYDMTRPHLASFGATVNGDDFLTDATGSRRFLSFRIENCNIEKLKEVDLKKAYSEAYQLYLSPDFRYWFNDEEIKEIDRKNGEFTITTVEQELIEKLYDLTNTGVSYSANEIKLFIESHTRDYISAKKIGEALAKLGVKRVSIRDQNNNVRKKYPITQRSISNY